ncbi:MAG: glycosyltransferase family 39 protein [Ignavibacteriaceae bacterium]|nr:glycosyltransferase family 39 protein [Ignavibacteriaceae bacterium]
MKQSAKKKIQSGNQRSADKSNLFFYLLILAVVPSILYFRVVNFGLTGLDDESLIININNLEGNKINLKEAFTHDALKSDRGDAFYRPMQIISLMVDAEISGTEPWMYHLSNLLLHILTVITLFFFLKETGIKDEISFLLSLLFAINPMFTNAVAWIPARGDLLLCLFSLLSFITFIKYCRSGKKNYMFLHGIVFAMAVFSKETSVLIPVLILTYSYYVLKEKVVLKKIVSFLAIWILIFGIFFYMRGNVLKVKIPSSVFGIVPFIKNLSTIPITFGRFFIPYDLSPMPYFNTLSVLIGIVLLIAFTALTIKFIKVEKRMVIWGAAWFLLFTIPPMLFRSFFADISNEYFDYRAYLPVIGILVIAGFIIQEWSAVISFNKMLRYSIPVLIIYLIMAFNYSDIFTDPIAFFTSAIKGNPHNAIAYNSRGGRYSEINIEAAFADYDSAISIDKTYSMPYFNEGCIYNTEKDFNKTELLLSRAIQYDTIQPEKSILNQYAYIILADAKSILKKYNESELLIKYAIRKYPQITSLHNNLGLCYYQTGKNDSAAFEFSRVLEKEQNYINYCYRGLAEYKLKDLNNALKDFRMSAELNPNFVDAYVNSGIARIELNDYEGAVSDLSRAIGMSSNSGAAFYYRGKAFLKLNKQSEAEKDWTEARKLGFKDTMNKEQKE